MMKLKLTMAAGVLAFLSFISWSPAAEAADTAPSQSELAQDQGHDLGGDADAGMNEGSASKDHEEGGGIHFVEIVIFIGAFLAAIAPIQEVCKKFKFPYTVALLIAGFGAQFLSQLIDYHPEVTLSPDVIFFLLLPILLFEAAMHINFHQFKLQFKTITFLATFGLMLSMFTVAFLLPLLVGVPFEVALLFGALISATDPIAVLALFKSLGAPKRLGLLADGESMFNDATGVLAFRIVSTITLSGTAFNQGTLLQAAGDFMYMFVGSFVAGAVIGYTVSQFIARVKEDALVETTLTLGAALLSFAAAEHFFHLSGVITSVVAGLVVGNLGRSRISAGVITFMKEFWGYLAYVALSLVFFFATYTLDLLQFIGEPLYWLAAVLAVLVARAVGVYVSFFFTNRLGIFRDEPDVPMSWQHILNWGGLRGVIPLVLVFSLPDDFGYKQDLFLFTFGALLFTLFVNGLTIEFLLKRLGLHLPGREEEIIREEMEIFELEEARERLGQLPEGEFSTELVGRVAKDLAREEKLHEERLLAITTEHELELSLRLHAIRTQRAEIEQLFRQNYINENVLYDFDAQLDLQQDALEYPEVYKGRSLAGGGRVAARISFRRQLLRLRQLAQKLPILDRMAGYTAERLVEDRYSLLKARLISTKAVLSYLDRVEKLMAKSKQKEAVKKVRETYEWFIHRNREELRKLENEYEEVVRDYQTKLLGSMVLSQVGKGEH